MIRIPPPWEGEKAQEFLALYAFMLYKTLPFAPGDYLPRDAKGPYYYENGDLTKKKYAPKTRSPFSLHPKAKEVLKKAGVHPMPDTLEAFIGQICPALQQYLYNPDHTVRRDKLCTLLMTRTDTATLRREGLDFSWDGSGGAKKDRRKKEILRLLQTEVFDYAKFCSVTNSRKEVLFPRLVQLMGVDVCPYCNRSFTATVKKEEGGFLRQDQIDHYRPKAVYPWFALTLPNLVPACSNCNLHKSDKVEPVLYPYQEGMEDRYRFRTRPVSGLGYLTGQPGSPEEFEVEIREMPANPAADPAAESEFQARVVASLDRFGLRALYRNSHNDYVRSIFAQRYVFTDDYLDSLIDGFPELFQTREDVRQMLYLKRYDLDALGKTPLAKLTRDIDLEISELLAGGTK